MPRNATNAEIAEAVRLMLEAEPEPTHEQKRALIRHFGREDMEAFRALAKTMFEIETAERKAIIAELVQGIADPSARSQTSPLLQAKMAKMKRDGKLQ